MEKQSNWNYLLGSMSETSDQSLLSVAEGRQRTDVHVFLPSHV